MIFKYLPRFKELTPQGGEIIFKHKFEIRIINHQISHSNPNNNFAPPDELNFIWVGKCKYFFEGMYKAEWRRDAMGLVDR